MNKTDKNSYMAPTRKSVSSRFHFTPERLRQATCPASKQQQLYWDDSPRCLGIRITANGAKTFIFEYRLKDKNARYSIGRADSWDLKGARQEASRLQQLVDSGIDPREERARRRRDAVEKVSEDLRRSVTVGALWPVYVEANQQRWSDAHFEDHAKAVQAPGMFRKRSNRLTKAGPAHALLTTRLIDLSPDTLEKWINVENRTRPTSTARAFRLLRAFLNWCEEQPQYVGLAESSVLFSRSVRRAVSPLKAKTDCLQREMLASWFEAVQKNNNVVVSAYLEALLLTGARRNEIASLRWADIDFRWRSMTIGDKVEGERQIPLPPYLAQRLNGLPRRNEWVFSSPASASGKLEDVYRAHLRAITAAELPHLTIHGLRRSFGTLSEWVECPVGIVAQIQGHKPSAIAEKHYRQRPLDLLRLWHNKIEGWMLGQAGIKQPNEDVVLSGSNMAIVK
jgi:integrase